MVDETFVVEVKRSKEDVEQESTIVGVKVLYGDDQREKMDVQTRAERHSAAFNKLSSSWTSTAISFFEIVPLLSDLGFLYADHALDSKTLVHVRSLAVSVDENEESGVLTERFTLNMRDSQSVSKSLSKTTQIVKTAGVMKRSALASLLSEYEAFIADLLTLAIEIRPEIVVDDEPRISLSDISDFSSLEELKEAQIKQRLDDMLRNSSHKEVLEWIGKKFKVELFGDTQLIADFVEVCQRRHLISHAGSKVNKRYVRICAEADCNSDHMLKLHDSVNIDRTYLRRATARVYQVGYFTLHLLWQKLLSEPKKSDGSIVSCSHDFLENDLTKMARRLTQFSLSRKSKKPDNWMHACLVINEAQSYKFDPSLGAGEKRDLMEKSLRQKDWSECSPMMELVIACLRDDYNGIETKVTNAAKVGENRLTYSDVFTYNIFREARDNSGFMEGVVEAFALADLGKKPDAVALPAPVDTTSSKPKGA
ncbi:MAG: hypothetical protein KAT26_02360 [Marinosulfonomonas sp.]|nr:hypothetical protein [Marinosulfonomonas sp.]